MMKIYQILFLLTLFVSCNKTNDENSTLIPKTTLFDQPEKSIQKDTINIIENEKPNLVERKKLTIEEINENLTRDISDRPLIVATYLETVGNLIKLDKTRYNWMENQHCNVGILAQLSNNMTPIELKSELIKLKTDKELYNDNVGSWSAITTQYCSVTNNSVPKIINSLLNLGFLRDDMYHIEYCSNKKILKESGLNINKLDSAYYTEQDIVAKYMLTWSKMIKKYHKVHDIKTINNNINIDSVIINNNPQIGNSKPNIILKNIEPINKDLSLLIVTNDTFKTIKPKNINSNKKKKIKQKRFENGNNCPQN